MDVPRTALQNLQSLTRATLHLVCSTRGPQQQQQQQLRCKRPHADVLHFGEISVIGLILTYLKELQTDNNNSCAQAVSQKPDASYAFAACWSQKCSTLLSLCYIIRADQYILSL